MRDLDYFFFALSITVDSMSDLERAKMAAGYAAADLIRDGMVVGLGTGSTVRYFIEKLGQRCKGGLSIKAVASSVATEELANKAGIPLISEFLQIDITVDGADFVDSQQRIIKGAGGALLREKILAFNSRRLIIIIDESKQVSNFPQGCLFPVEITPFGHSATISRLGFPGRLRTKNGKPYITDNQNLIFDIELMGYDVELVHEKAQKIPGVIETGLFLHLANELIIGSSNGSAKVVKCKN